MQAITTIGLDIAKSVFQVHGVDADGQVVMQILRIRLSDKTTWARQLFGNRSPMQQALSRLRTEWFGNIRGDLLAGLVVALALIPRQSRSRSLPTETG